MAGLFISVGTAGAAVDVLGLYNGIQVLANVTRYSILKPSTALLEVFMVLLSSYSP